MSRLSEHEARLAHEAARKAWNRSTFHANRWASWREVAGVQIKWKARWYLDRLIEWMGDQPCGECACPPRDCDCPASVRRTHA